MKKDCRINGKPATLDQAAKFAAEALASGATVEILPPPCPKCGKNMRYRSNPSPNWMNRWTCPNCGRHESR